MVETEVTGKAKGGLKRAENLSPERRREIAMQGAEARHQAKTMRATHTGVLKIADLEIPCYVLEDGSRMLSQRGLNDALGMQQGGGQNMPRFLGHKALQPFISKDLTAGITKPVKCLMPHGGNPANGMPATVLPEVCDVWLRAREAGALRGKHLETAQRAEILARGLAAVGIIALVDEATGYQGVRPQDALQAYLEAVIRKELAAWAKRFPDEFYENIYKLRGWIWPGMQKNRFSVVAHYTRDLVYERIGPSVLEELESRTPKNERGRRKNKLHQWLTEDIGHPLLAQHMHALIMFQRLAIKNGYGWNRFLKMVDQVLPKRGATLELPLPDPSVANEP